MSPSLETLSIPRREFLWSCGGLGAIALGQMLGRDQLAAGETQPRPDWNGGLHHRARARRVIQLFMNGGVSPADTFDYKPSLIKHHGEKFDPGSRVESVTGSPGFKVMKSPFDWKQHGQSGRWVSSVLPRIEIGRASCRERV